jgi:hypothetical protein
VSIYAGPVHLFEFCLEPNVWHVNICATIRVHSSFKLIQLFLTSPFCYGRLAVVSDVDDGGFALNVDNELRGSAVL